MAKWSLGVAAPGLTESCIQRGVRQYVPSDDTLALVMAAWLVPGGTKAQSALKFAGLQEAAVYLVQRSFKRRASSAATVVPVV